MEPSERKSVSETLLKQQGIAINPHLPCIEAENEVTLRTADELTQRMLALWAVATSATQQTSQYYREYILARGYRSWFSEREAAFLSSETRTPDETIEFSWRYEALYFLAWCAGLIENIELPMHESSLKEVGDLFPKDMEEPTVLRAAVKIRSKEEILRWSDLLYRLHWAVRDAYLNQEKSPAQVNGGVVQEWHHAVNWMTRYNEEDNWDEVTTDT